MGWQEDPHSCFTKSPRRTCPQARGTFLLPAMPRKEVGSTQGATKGEPKRCGSLLTCSCKKEEIRVETKKWRQERINLQTKKKKKTPQTKGEKRTRGKQANQDTRFTCRKQKLRARRTQPLMKQEIKEAKSDSNHRPVLVVPFSLLVQYRAICLSTIL